MNLLAILDLLRNLPQLSNGPYGLSYARGLFLLLLLHPVQLTAKDPFEVYLEPQTCEKIEKELNGTTNPSRLARLYFVLGKCYEKQQKYDTAFVAFLNAYNTSASALTPNELLYIAQFLEQNQDQKRALEIARHIITKYPQYKEAHEFLNKINGDIAKQELLSKCPPCEKQTAENETEGSSQETAEVAPPDCNLIRGQIQAVERVQKFDKLPPLYRDLGKCYEVTQKSKEALEFYEKALSSSYPFSAADRIHMAVFLGDSGKEDIAITTLQTTLHNGSINEQGLIDLAKFLNWRGEKDDQKEAEKYIDEILKKEPKKIKALLIKGAILNATERSKQAVELFDYLLSKNFKLSDEETFSAKTGIIRAYINLKEYVSAEKDLAKLEAVYPYQQKEIDDLNNQLKEGKDEEPKKKEQNKQFVQDCIDNALNLSGKRCFLAAYWELYKALQKDPCNWAARIALANTLANDGRYWESARQLDIVFAYDPKNIDVWIALGNLLQYRENIVGSTYAFQEALCLNSGNFDALLGLANTELARDERVNAYRLMLSMYAEEDEQRKEISDFMEYLVLGPLVKFDYSRFKDSDDIITQDFLLEAAGYYRDYRLCGFYHHVRATQPVDKEIGMSIRENVDEFKAEIVKRVCPLYDVIGGIGYAHTTEGQFATGRLKTNVRTPCGIINAGSEYDLYTWTAAAIFFKIRQWRNFISYYNKFTGRWTGGGDYEYVYWSDGNHSNKVDLFAKYQFYAGFCWNIYVDYIVTYWDFEEQILTPFVSPGVLGGHGYFDPRNYFENQLGLRCELNTRRFDFLIHPFGAYVTYDMQGLYNGFYLIGRGDATFKFSNKLSVGISLEGGRYPLKNINYTYSQLSGHFYWAY